MNYPPLQQTPIDPETGKLTRPWALYFQTLQSLPSSASRWPSTAALVGRQGSTTTAITVGNGLLLENGVLTATDTHYYEPLTNGDVLLPDLIFADGDVIMCARLT